MSRAAGPAVTADPTTADAVAEVHRRQWPVVLAATVRVARDLDLAEDCAQDAFARALSAWDDGVPDDPVAWLVTVARNRARDLIRRQVTLRTKLPLLLMPEESASEQPQRPTDPLRLVFTACHPALAPEAQVPLALRLLCGLSTAEIAAGLLLKEATVQARVTRAKRKIARAGIPFRVPDGDELADRLDAVLTVVHLVHTSGHTAVDGPALTRPDLTARAVELARLLVRLMPEEAEAHGLLALLLLTEARRPGRLSADGQLLLLREQDRSTWSRPLVHEGLAHATRALRDGQGRYALQAAIAGLHSSAPSWDLTDWTSVVRMYEALTARWPSPVVALNAAAARSLVPGADLAAVLVELRALETEPTLASYPYLPAATADVLVRLGRGAEAVVEYDRALALAGNHVEREFLRRRRAEVGGT